MYPKRVAPILRWIDVCGGCVAVPYSLPKLGANKEYFVLFILQEIAIAEIECKSHKFHNTAKIILRIFVHKTG